MYRPFSSEGVPWFQHNGHKIFIGIMTYFRKFTLFVDEGHDVDRSGSNQIENDLVIDEFDMFPGYPFFVVVFLFHLKNVLNEELLEMFISVVDAKLLEAIIVEIFKSKNIQNADGVFRIDFRLEYRVVDLIHYHDKESAVDSFDKGISHLHRLIL